MGLVLLLGLGGCATSDTLRVEVSHAGGRATLEWAEASHSISLASATPKEIRVNDLIVVIRDGELWIGEQYFATLKAGDRVTIRSGEVRINGELYGHLPEEP